MNQGNKNRVKILLIITFLIILTGLPVMGQNGFVEEHEYQGTQEDELTGTLTGTITLDSQPPSQVERRIREYPVLSIHGTSNLAPVDYDFTPYTINGDIDLSESKTFITYRASVGFAGTGTSSFEVQPFVNGQILSNLGVSPCEDSIFIASQGSSTSPSRGGNFMEARCVLPYFSGTTQLRVQVTEVEVFSPFWSLDISQVEVYNHTISHPDHPTSSFEGSFTGTSTGTHQGFIEKIEAEASLDNATFENVTTTNLTVTNQANTTTLSFQNLVGALSVDELDFWIPLVFFTLVAWFAFNRDATLIGLAAILGIIFVLTDMPAWSIAATMMLMALGLSAEYLSKRVWQRKNRNR